jgi:hypothetical protein
MVKYHVQLLVRSSKFSTRVLNLDRTRYGPNPVPVPGTRIQNQNQIQTGALIFCFLNTGVSTCKDFVSLQCGPRKDCTGTSRYFWAPRPVLSQPRAVHLYNCFRMHRY